MGGHICHPVACWVKINGASPRVHGEAVAATHEAEVIGAAKDVGSAFRQQVLVALGRLKDGVQRLEGRPGAVLVHTK